MCNSEVFAIVALRSVTPAIVDLRRVTHLPSWLSDVLHTCHRGYQTCYTPAIMALRRVTHLPTSLSDVLHTCHSDYQTCYTPAIVALRRATHLPSWLWDVLHTCHRGSQTCYTPVIVALSQQVRLLNENNDCKKCIDCLIIRPYTGYKMKSVIEIVYLGRFPNLSCNKRTHLLNRTIDPLGIDQSGQTFSYD